MTIKDRAVEWCNSIINKLDTSDLYRGYIHGAVEQRDIDINKACSQFRFILGKVFVPLIVDALEEDFRKAMEGEK